MQSKLRSRSTACFAHWLATAAVVACTFAAQAQPEGRDAEAERLLKASTDFLARQQRFSIDTRNSLEVVLKSGQKIEFNHRAKQSIQRPNKLRAQRTGDLVEQLFVYDGKSLTVYDQSKKAYATVGVPDTIEGMFDFARKSLDIVAPAADLIDKNAYQVLTESVTQSLVVGKAVIEGVRCDHLAFRAPLVDWQIWIQEGPQPLPRKMVITTRDMVSAPQFSVTVTKWNLNPTFGAQTFAFAAPAGAVKVDLLPR